jgi:hypothetical protein
MNYTQKLVNEIRINNLKKNNLGLKNRENINYSKKNKIIKYNYSYSSNMPNSLNKSVASNKINKSRIKIIKLLFQIVEIIKSNKHLNTNIFKSMYEPDELKIIKNKKEWIMNCDTLKKTYVNASIKWKSENNYNENEYRFLFLTVVYERMIIKDIEAILFCFWLYDQNNDSLFIY